MYHRQAKFPKISGNKHKSTSTSYVDVVTLDIYATVVVLVKERKREIGKLEEPGMGKRQNNSKVWPSHVFIPSTPTNPATVATKGYGNPTGISQGITGNYLWLVLHMQILRGGQGVRTPPENHKNIGFLSNTGLDPLLNYKATKPPSQHSKLGNHWPVSETPFKMMARF